MTIPGYLPITNDPTLVEVFRENAVPLVGKGGFVTRPSGHARGGSTDMGDLSQIMPVIHPYTGGAAGVGHGTDYLVVDYQQAVINPAKAMATSVVDLLSEGAAKAKEVLAASRPAMTKEQYLELQEGRQSEELYEGR